MTDTICAVSTAAVKSAVGVIRISGPEALPLSQTVFSPAGARTLSDAPHHTMIYGSMTDGSGKVLDYGLAVYMPAGHSYTGEDVVELQCHGSPVVLGEILRILLLSGARQAEAGEFTRRAFINGRLDLTRAEAVADLIDASTPQAAYSAADQLGGSIARQVREIYDALTLTAAHFQALVDYPEEDIAPLEIPSLAQTLTDNASRLQRLAETYQRGRILREGVVCAIIGRPNTGKSSLLNALSGYERAIVTHHPGTTRDTVEESVNVGGVLLRLTDTAGIRETRDHIETLGILRSRDAAQSAGLVLAVLDGSEPLCPEDERVLDIAQERKNVIIINKADLGHNWDERALSGRFGHICRISAKNGTGLDELGRIVSDLFALPEQGRDDAIITNARHAASAEHAAGILARAAEALREGMTPDAVLTDVEQAMAALGEVTGANVSEDILSSIFARFCVGK